MSLKYERPKLAPKRSPTRFQEMSRFGEKRPYDSREGLSH